MKSLLIIFLSIMILPVFAPSHPDYTEIDPPLKQVGYGIKPSNVVCTQGLELVLKKSNGMPACIKPLSISKLIERDWAIHVLPDYMPKNNNSEIFVEGNFDVKTESVNYFGKSNGYLAKPVGQENFPGIVMIHEWWGLNNNIREMAQKLASHGYVVLAVDLYDGQVAKTSEEARSLITSFDPNDGIENMNSAVIYLQENFNSKSLGSIGWCFGGGQSLNLALNNQQMNATVIYYGSLVSDVKTLSSIDWPVLGIFAELDNGITIDDVQAFEASLNELNIQNSIHIYPSVDHAFANPSGDRYAPTESKDAWQKTLTFFNENLK